MHRCLLAVLLASFACLAQGTGHPRPAAEAPLAPEAAPGGDCNDTDASVHPDHAEVAGNRIDDDCDGLADEDEDGNPSGDVSDTDTDGFSLASGDCNDTNPSIRPGVSEIADNLFDDDCDGLADEDAGNNPSGDLDDHDEDGIPIGPDLIFASGFEP